MTQPSPLKLNCSRCGTEIEWSEAFPHRPFCSLRCKQTDFVAWANEEQVLPGSDEESDYFSEDTMRRE